jgi:6-methylsalicylate decarboxylase
MTRYGPDDTYLGHPSLTPLWTALNARAAVVFIHPTHGTNTTLVNAHLPLPMFDYPHETGRAAMDLITSGRMPSVRACRIILSHAGGTLPYIFMRAAGMLPHTPFGTGETTAELLAEAREFYFDTAISGNEFTLGLLRRFAKRGHVLFGTDFPNAPREGIEWNTRGLEAWMDGEDVGEEERREWEERNARRVFGHD